MKFKQQDNAQPKHLSGKRLSQEEKEFLIQEWWASGLTKVDFCKNKGIPSSSFAEWCARLSPEKDNQHGNVQGDAQWAPVALTEQHGGGVDQEQNFELELPGHIIVRAKMSVTSIVQLISDLCHAAAIVR